MRKVSTVTITADGRDKNKVFQITEMSAYQAECWAIRVFLSIAKTGIELPEGVAEGGMAGIAAVGIKALTMIPWADAEPLLIEMMGCVRIIPDPSRPSVIRDLIDDDIEEVATRLRLKMDVFGLHTGFSMAGLPQTTAGTGSATGTTAA
jgi:hypothetical protein